MSALAELQVETFEPVTRPKLRLIQNPEEIGRQVLLMDGDLDVRLDDKEVLDKKGRRFKNLEPMQKNLILTLSEFPDTTFSREFLADLLGTTAGAVKQQISNTRRALGKKTLGHPETGALITLNKRGVLIASSHDREEVMRPRFGEKVDSFGTGRIEVNLSKKIVRGDGRWLRRMRFADFKIAGLFARTSPHWVTPEEVALAVSDRTDDKAIEHARMHMAKFKKRLGPKLAELIITILGTGYYRSFEGLW